METTKQLSVFMSPLELQFAKALGDEKQAQKQAAFGINQAYQKNEAWAMAGKMAFAKFLGIAGQPVPKEWKVRTLTHNHLIVRESDDEARALVMVTCRRDFGLSLRVGENYTIQGWIWPAAAKRDDWLQSQELNQSWWVPRQELTQF